MARKRFAWLFAATLVCGCSQDGLEGEALDGKINEIASSVNNGKQRYKSLDNLNDLLSEFRKCKTHEFRLKKVGEFATQVEENCPRLENSDCSSYIVAVRRFGLNVGYVITAQEESGVDVAVRMEFCCRMLGKYKESCFAIPWTAKAANESEFAFRERLNAAHVLMNEYAEETASWKRFAFPRIRENLAPEARDEFDRKCAELLSFPSAEEFRRSPMMMRTTCAEKGSVQGDAIAEECKSFLNNTTSAKDRAELDRKIRVAVQTAGDCQARSVIVRSMVAELLRADLSLRGSDYQDMSRRVSAYENCSECVVHWLFDSGLDGQYVMESFFACMGKLRSACFSVPQTGRLLGENEIEFEKRCYAVWNMMEDYGHAMRLWDLSCDKHLQVLPVELRGEYLEKRKPFLEYVSGRKLREKMMFNGR